MNTGFGSAGPELAVPERLAEVLGLWPRLPPEAYRHEAEQADGPLSADVVPDACQVEAVTEDRTTGPVCVTIVILHHRRDALISAALTEALRIDPVKPSTGFWRFADEPDKLRPSAPPQSW